MAKFKIASLPLLIAVIIFMGGLGYLFFYLRTRPHNISTVLGGWFLMLGGLVNVVAGLKLRMVKNWSGGPDNFITRAWPAPIWLTFLSSACTLTGLLVVAAHLGRPENLGYMVLSFPNFSSPVFFDAAIFGLNFLLTLGLGFYLANRAQAQRRTMFLDILALGQIVGGSGLVIYIYTLSGGLGPEGLLLLMMYPGLFIMTGSFLIIVAKLAKGL